MEQHILDIENLFYSGQFIKVNELLPLNLKNLDLVSLKIATMVFIGNFLEAEIFLKNHEKTLSNDLKNLSKINFYLGIGAVRISDYKKAIKYFSINLKLLKNKKITSEIKFYIYQGHAFFNFFKGNFLKSCEISKLSYEEALSTQFIFGETLALDLLGHSLINLGSIQRGIFELERAKAHALKTGNSGMVQALLVSIVNSKAQFGIDILNSINNLNLTLKNLKTDDTYSRAEIYLELSRQLIIRGQGEKAEDVLEEAGHIIYKHQNKRQSAIFNLRYAYLLFLKGEKFAVITLIRSLKSNLDQKIDFYILTSVLELEKTIQL